MQAPLDHSVLNPKGTEFILAQTCLWIHAKHGVPDSKHVDDYVTHLASVVNFLGIFAGFWPSRVERSHYSKQWVEFGAQLTDVEDLDLAAEFKPSTGCCIQLHFRTFVPVQSLMNTSTEVDGLSCQRHGGRIISSNSKLATLVFEERRASVFGFLSDARYSRGETFPAMYRVLVLSDGSMVFDEDEISCGLELRPGLEGTRALHAAIIVTVTHWETEWNNMLDRIDECLRFEFSQTMNTKEIHEWMFDGDFARSTSCFTILQVLRIFGECIRTVAADLRALDELFLTPSLRFSDFHDDELLVLKSNWELVTKHQNAAESRLLGRILDKNGGGEEPSGWGRIT